MASLQLEFMERFSFSLLLVLPAMLISILGSFIIWSVNPDLLSSHLVFLLAGFVIFLALSRIDIIFLRALSPLTYILLLIGLLFLFTQPAIRGAQRWLIIGNTTIQLAEIGKPLYILALAWICSRFIPRSLRHLLIFLLIGIFPILLVLRQPDLGNAVLYLAVFLGLFFSSYSKLRYLVVFTLFGMLLLPLGINQLADYQKERLVSFVTPNYDPQGIGYNAAQALIAVGSGRLTGRGLGSGTQSHLRFLPESDTDFVFASLTEELGFVGGFLLLLSYSILLYGILNAAAKSTILFTRLLAIGIFVQLFAQIFVNIGMNLGLVPITGVTLPLVSSGGSSIISTFIALGLVQSIASYKEKREVVIR